MNDFEEKPAKLTCQMWQFVDIIEKVRTNCLFDSGVNSLFLHYSLLILIVAPFICYAIIIYLQNLPKSIESLNFPSILVLVFW